MVADSYSDVACRHHGIAAVRGSPAQLDAGPRRASADRSLGAVNLFGAAASIGGSAFDRLRRWVKFAHTYTDAKTVNSIWNVHSNRHGNNQRQSTDCTADPRRAVAYLISVSTGMASVMSAPDWKVYVAATGGTGQVSQIYGR